MARNVPLIRQRDKMSGFDEARRTLRRLNRKPATSILRDDASAYARAANEGARIVHRLRG